MTSTYDIATPAGWRRAWWRLMLSDHGLVRVFWSNMHEIAPGVWRANQPTPARLRRWRARGIRSIVNLRGDEPTAYYLLESAACRDLGLRLYNMRFSARRLAPAAKLISLLDILRDAERPLVMHCKSGADRAGLASALYLIDALGLPVKAAERQLSLRYLHLRGSNRGASDYLLKAYAADTANAPTALRDWLVTRYDPAALEVGFAASRGRGG